MGFGQDVSVPDDMPASIPCYLSLGSNLGQREENLRQAVAHIETVMAVTAVSAVYETPPWGVTDQPDFLNICLAGAADLPPRPLFTALKAIETRMGRQPTYRWGPRLIDIDLLFYGDWIISDADLVIPHPRLAERAFVLAPLADIAPDFVHPQNHKTVSALLAELDCSGLRRRFDWQAQPEALHG